MIDMICSLSGIDRDELLGTRKGFAPIYRAMIYTQLRKRGYSTLKIGVLFGRNHASVINGCKMLSDVMSVDREVSAFYSRFVDAIYGRGTESRA